MSYLQKYVRQVKPRNESYIPPVDKIQTFLVEGDTKDATDMESVIVACWNNRALLEEDFKALIGTKKIKDSISNKTYTIPRKIKNPQTALWEFSILLKEKVPDGVSGDMKPAGKTDPSTSNFWEVHTGKTKDTSKADITIGDSGISVKGVSAVLMSGIATETKATALAAFTKANPSGTNLTATQQAILAKIEEMIGSSDRIDYESTVTAGEINTRSRGQLTPDEAERYGITYNKKTGKYIHDRWLTVTNMERVNNPEYGEVPNPADWSKVKYSVDPDIPDKSDAEKDVITARINAAASEAIKQAKVAKTDLEERIKAEFNTLGVQEAFAWEAMSGEVKFNEGGGKGYGQVPTGKGGNGFAEQMLVFDWGLKSMAWHNIDATDSHVKTAAKKMKPKFNMKGGSYEAAGQKAGYSFSQTLRFSVDYLVSKVNASDLVLQQDTYKAEQMLAEGVLNEWAFWDKLKKIWDNFISELKGYWNKFVNMLWELKDKVVEVFDAGIYSVLNYFELDVSVKVNTRVRLL